MSTKVIMPQMGESIFEGTITKWLKKVGDSVDQDEPLFEVSIDKVDSEIPSPVSGVLEEIIVPEGKTAQINTVVAVIGGENEEALPPDLAEVPPLKDEPAAEERPTEESASEESPVEEIVSPEASQEVEKPETVPAPVSESTAAIPEPEEDVPPEPSLRAKDIRTSPLVRRLARQHKIDLSRIKGTGLSGRITKQDIQKYIDQIPQLTEEPVAEPGEEITVEEQQTDAPPTEAPVLSETVAEQDLVTTEESRPQDETEAVVMTTMRKAIAEHMVKSKHTSAHVHTVFHVDVTSLEILRKRHEKEFEAREGIRLTFTAFLVKALVDTVREFPAVNCSVSGDSIVYKKSINVGVAVALEDGLIVPVVKDAHLKSLTGLALAIHDLAERARTKRLLPDDVQGGTISITNPGIYGAAFATPIIHQPQVAILGVGGIEKRPVVIDDAIAIRSMVYLTLGFDHRVIDGAIADQFMAALKNRLQSWSQWIE